MDELAASKEKEKGGGGWGMGGWGGGGGGGAIDDETVAYFLTKMGEISSMKIGNAEFRVLLAYFMQGMFFFFFFLSFIYLWLFYFLVNKKKGLIKKVEGKKKRMVATGSGLVGLEKVFIFSSILFKNIPNTTTKITTAMVCCFAIRR